MLYNVICIVTAHISNATCNTNLHLQTALFFGASENFSFSIQDDFQTLLSDTFKKRGTLKCLTMLRLLSAVKNINLKKEKYLMIAYIQLQQQKKSYLKSAQLY